MSSEITHEPAELLEQLIEQKEGAQLQELLQSLTPADVARSIALLDDAGRLALVTLLDPRYAADLMEELSDLQGADLMEDLPPEQAAAIIAEMESDHRADLLAELNDKDAEAILRSMDPEEARDARQLLEFPPDTAGGIMVTEFVVYPQDSVVSEVLADLRTNVELYSDLGVQYAYVHNEFGTLVGVLRLRDLVLSRGEKAIKDVMIVNPVSVLANATIEELEQLFDRYPFYGIPVVNDMGQMIGVVERSDFEEAITERNEKSFMKFSGIVGGDELRMRPVFRRSSERLSWLVVNMALSALAAAVIVLFEDTLHEVIALAALMPVLANISGCSGNQAVAVSIRELSLGIIQPRDMTRVLRSEFQVGLINGAALGILLGSFTFIWKNDLGLAIVAGAALAINSMVAVSWGSTAPLILRRLGIDPAAAAPPMLTTLTDMCGFFLILALATIFLI